MTVSIVVESAVPLQIVTTSLPAGQVGVPYRHVLEAATAFPPVVWRISEGRLPEGLMLVDDRIEGTPTAGGTAVFEVEVADALDIVQRALTLEVVRRMPPNTSSPLQSAADVGCRCLAFADRPSVPAGGLALAGALVLVAWRRRRFS